MDIQKDFADLCALLIAKRVDFLVVGGYALAFHGAPRFTGDLDLLVRPDPVQVKAMLEVVDEFGFPASEVSRESLLRHKKILPLGRVPVQIHIMTNISGMDWDAAGFRRRKEPMVAFLCFFWGEGLSYRTN